MNKIILALSLGLTNCCVFTPQILGFETQGPTDDELHKQLTTAIERLNQRGSYRQIEAPHIYQHDGWFYLFVNWGKCCSGVDSTYNIRVGRSRTITGPYFDKDGVDLANGGGTLLLGSEGPFIGPGHANVLREGDRFLLSCHYYDGTERGRSRLSIQELAWSKEGWPVVAETPDFKGASNRTDQLPTEWLDPKTQHRVAQLSKQAGSANFYFHQNAYTPHLK